MKFYLPMFINCRDTVFCSFRFLLIFPPFCFTKILITVVAMKMETIQLY
jgi:hypothetical protein